MQPTKEPRSRTVSGTFCIFCTPPRNKLCGSDKCQNPLGDIVITSGNWSTYERKNKERIKIMR